MARKSFSIHSDYYEELQNLGVNRLGQITSALISWAKDDVIPPLDSEVAMLFRLMCAQIDRISKANSDNGRKGGAQEGNRNAVKTSERAKNKRNKPSVTVTVTDTDTDSIPVTSPSAGKGRGGVPTFDQFWAIYPKKVGKAAAIKAWGVLKPDALLLQKILEAISHAQRSDQWRRENGRYIPNPATWLNQGRWDDVIDAKGGGPHESTGFKPDGFNGFSLVDDP